MPLVETPVVPIASPRRRSTRRGCRAAIVAAIALGWGAAVFAAAQARPAAPDRFEPLRRRMHEMLLQRLDARAIGAWNAHRALVSADSIDVRTTTSLSLIEAGVERVATYRAFNVVLLQAARLEPYADSGSGVIAYQPGIVVTAAHVAGPRGRKHKVGFLDGGLREGVSMGGLADDFIDIGVVRFEAAPEDPPPVPLGTDAVNVPELGEWVVSFGFAPLPGTGSDLTVRTRVGRVLRRLGPSALVDATFAPGDSGGPVFAMDGSLVGIATQANTRDAEANSMQTGDVLRAFVRTIITTGGNADATQRWSPLALNDQHVVPTTERFIAEHIEARAAVSIADVGVLEVLDAAAGRAVRACLATRVGPHELVTKASVAEAVAIDGRVWLRDGAGRVTASNIIGCDGAADLALLSTEPDARAALPGRTLRDAALRGAAPFPGMILLCPGVAGVEAAGVSQGTIFPSTWIEDRRGANDPRDQLPVSGRRSGFGPVIVCDADLPPDACGGPVVNLDAAPLGIAIARFDRSAVLVLPMSTIEESVIGMRAPDDERGAGVVRR